MSVNLYCVDAPIWKSTLPFVLLPMHIYMSFFSLPLNINAPKSRRRRNRKQKNNKKATARQSIL